MRFVVIPFSGVKYPHKMDRLEKNPVKHVLQKYHADLSRKMNVAITHRGLGEVVFKQLVHNLDFSLPMPISLTATQ